MPIRERLRRLLQHACLALPLAATPGCVTWGLWGHSFLDDEPLWSEQRVEVLRHETRHQQVILEPTMAAGAEALLLRGGDGEASWWLRPVRDADVALRLLTRAAGMSVATVTVTAVRDLRDDAVVRADAQLVVRGRPDAIGEVIDAATIGPEAARVLREPRTNAFAFAADPMLFLPAVVRACVRSLPTASLAEWLELPGESMRMASFVFVGTDGLPRFEPGSEAPAVADDESLSLADRLDFLASLALLLRVDCGSRQCFVRLRPDRLWLSSACDVEAGQLCHSSAWLLEPASPAALAGPSPAPWTVAAQLQCTDTHTRLCADPPMHWAVRAALTPLALALDLTVLLPANALVSMLREHEDEDRDEREGRRR